MFYMQPAVGPEACQHPFALGLPVAAGAAAAGRPEAARGDHSAAAAVQGAHGGCRHGGGTHGQAAAVGGAGANTQGVY